MRVKLRNYAPLPASSKLVWDRITFSRLTIAYFAFSIVHFFIQISFQIRAFTINADAAHLLNKIVVEGNAFNDSLPILSGNSLHLCSWVPSNLNLDGYQCPIVWNGTEGANATNAQFEESTTAIASIVAMASIPEATSVSVVSSTAPLPSASSNMNTLSSINQPTTTVSATSNTSGTETITVFVRPTSPTVNNKDEDNDYDLDRRGLFARNGPRIFVSEGGITSVNISSLGSQEFITLNSSCLWALNWPVSVLDNTKREDIVFIAFQLWLLGMSVVALLNESIPHVLASLVTHIMATAWAAFQIQHTADFKSNFTRVITEGACRSSGVSLLPTSYWKNREIAELSSLAFNILALFVSSFLTWRLFKLFGWQTFKRVGASLTINRIYKIVLTLSITIQLSMFFMAVTVSLWIDRLFNSAIGDLVDFETLYKVSSFITLVLLIPWLMTGWFAVRRELRFPMFFFLVLSILYLGGWSVMFFSTTFRWNFVTWRFFSIMATASVFLTVASLVLGVICRYNFGKGLLRYLNAQQNLPDDDFRHYGEPDEEKVEFPFNETPVPTYAEAFGSGPDTLPYIAQGPRFFDRSAEPFETGKISPVTPPPIAYTIARSVSGKSSNKSRHVIMRSNTRSSDTSIGSLASFYSYDKGHGRSDSQKRWVIE